MENKTKQILTIAICTYNRSDYIEHVLLSLVQQTISSSQYSLLIVDNNSTDSTQSIVQSFSDKFKNFKICVEHKQGLSFARNRAIQECITPWIAFLDDDAKADKNWVKEVLYSIKRNDFDAFGGPYTAWLAHGPLPSWLPSDYGNYRPIQSYGPLQQGTHIPGGNCAIRLEICKKVGEFSHNMGMKGKSCGYGEETLLFMKMQQQGFRLGFVPAMKIEHCVLPHKYNLIWQLRSAFSGGRDWIRLQQYIGNQKNIPYYLYIFLLTTVKCIKYFRIYTFKKALFLYIKDIFHKAGYIAGSIIK